MINSLKAELQTVVILVTEVEKFEKPVSEKNTPVKKVATPEAAVLYANNKEGEYVELRLRDRQFFDQTECSEDNKCQIDIVTPNVLKNIVGTYAF